MNSDTDQIEKLLRCAPRVPAPPGLLERLKGDIRLPADRRPERVQNYSPSFFKRWLPALSVAIWLLACIVILAVQSNMLKQLRQEQEAVRAAAAEVQQHAPPPSADTELARLRADYEEVQKLRAEVAQLTERLQSLEPLRAENQQLAVELRNSQRSNMPPGQDFFAQAVQKAENARCINNLKQLGLGARMWSNDHGDHLPTSFDQMQNELPDRKVLFCTVGGEATVQFELVSPGASETDPQVVYARCPRHNNVVLCDGSAHILGENLKLVVRPDGKTVIGR